MSIWARIRCLFTRTCNVFDGDEFTEYLAQHKRAAEESRESIAQRRRGLEYELYPDTRRRGQGHTP